MITKIATIKRNPTFSNIIEKVTILFIIILSLTLGFVSGIIYTNKETKTLAAYYDVGRFNLNTGVFEWKKN
jgi:hypothetical protein